MENKIILVTGVTGYIGGRLVPVLIGAGYRVRVLVRDTHRLQGRAWLEQVEVVEGAGLAYWYLLYPFHRIIFGGMIRNLASRALAIEEAN